MMYEKMEEDYDYTLWENAYREYEQSGRKSRPASEFWEEVEKDLDLINLP